MRRAFLRFGVVVSLLCLVRTLLAYEQSTRGEVEPLAASLTLLSDPESLLATGQKMPLACADVASLELISGVSDRMALGLIEQYPRIATSIREGASAETALQLAHGVGPATAKKLLHYLDVSTPCTSNQSFEPFSPTEAPLG
jgi:hypothetical protein